MYKKNVSNSRKIVENENKIKSLKEAKKFVDTMIVLYLNHLNP